MMPTDTGWVFKFLLVVAANNPVRGQEQDIEVTAAPVHRDIRHLSFISLPLSFLSKDPLIGCELRNKNRFISQLAARIFFLPTSLPLYPLTLELMSRVVQTFHLSEVHPGNADT